MGIGREPQKGFPLESHASRLALRVGEIEAQRQSDSCRVTLWSASEKGLQFLMRPHELQALAWFADFPTIASPSQDRLSPPGPGPRQAVNIR